MNLLRDALCYDVSARYAACNHCLLLQTLSQTIVFSTGISREVRRDASFCVCMLSIPTLFRETKISSVMHTAAVTIEKVAVMNEVFNQPRLALGMTTTRLKTSG